ncbi:MAG: PAS domain S-box protein [Chthoniobacterales bacterium]
MTSDKANAQGTESTSRSTLEDSLRVSEERFRVAFAQSVTGMAITDLKGTILRANDSFCRIVGRPVEEIVDRNTDHMTHPDDRRANSEIVQEVLEGNRGSGTFSKRYVRPDGTVVWTRINVSRLRQADGTPSGLMATIEDVTTQRAAEEELAEARAKAELALESERARLAEVFRRSPSFLAISRGPEHIFEFTNDRYKELSGHRDVLGKTVREAFPEIQGQGYFEILDRVYRTGEPFEGKEMTVLLQRLPGEPMEKCIVDLVYMPTRDAAGEVDGIFTHGIDVTDRKLAEETLEQQARTFAILLASIPDYVFTFDAEHRFTFANQVLLDLWGITAEQAVEKSMSELNYDPRVEEQLGRDIDIVYRSGKSVTGEVNYTSPIGVSGYFEYNLAPVLGPAGKVVNVAGTGRDISVRKQAEAEREQLLTSERAARSEAERASLMKDEFLATLSHELRTPLNAILGWANILSLEATPDDYREGLQVIERNARAQARIIDDLLDMNRIMSGKVRLDVQSINLAAVVEAAIETVRPAAEAKSVRLQSILDPLAQPVRGDPSRLQQVFWNLLSNAVKFTPKGGRVQMLLERVNSHLEVRVVDTGEGIAPEFIPHVFDRFRQADPSTTRAHGGLGLGLAIVKQLVELHGGNVHVRSAGPGTGSTFTVSLPVGVIQPETAGEPARRHPRSHDPLPFAAIAALDLRGVKVLVVDDEADARGVVAHCLGLAGAEVRPASSAEEAFELVRAVRPDVIISDIGMPGEDGYSLIQRVRTLAPNEGGTVPAIALTAYARAEDRMRAVLAGFQMHISKPVEVAELLAMVASLTGRTIQGKSR